jgi:predicted RNase H-like nuclease (RuvC/YqgF family)
MSNLIDLVKKSKDTVINIGVVTLGIVVISATVYGVYVTKKIEKLENENQQIKIQKEVLNSEIKLQKKMIEEDRVRISKAEKNVEEKDKKINDLLKQVDALEKIKDVELSKTPEEVKSKIYKWYGDATVEFTSDYKFSFIPSTTYSLVRDAENWLINGPILTYNNKILTESNLALRDGIDARNVLIDEYKTTNLNKDALIVKYESKDKLSSDQIKNLEKQLTLKSHTTIYKVVGSFLAGAVTYYVIDRIRKH